MILHTKKWGSVYCIVYPICMEWKLQQTNGKRMHLYTKLNTVEKYFIKSWSWRYGTLTFICKIFVNPIKIP